MEGAIAASTTTVSHGGSLDGGAMREIIVHLRKTASLLGEGAGIARASR